jgi:chloramphenicol-sensitive protein RarD
VSTTATSERGRGFAFAIASYVWWGFLPLFFVALVPSGAVEIVAWRIVLSVVFCALIIVVTRAWAPFLAIVRDRRSMLLLAAASVFILVNWLVYVFAAVSGHVVEASLGYFINPIVTVLLGVLVLRERLRVLQWIAVGISALAVVVLAVNYGQPPWISLALAFSFGLYGLVKKQVGPKVDAVSGLTIETAYLAPAASIALIVIATQGDLTMGAVSVWHTVLLLFAGVITAVPLLLFASGARRLPLVYMGLVQYFAPVLQLIIGAWIMHEAMPPARWAGFAIVWVALALLSFDGLRHGTRQRAAALATTPEGAP